MSQRSLVRRILLWLAGAFVLLLVASFGWVGSVVLPFEAEIETREQLVERFGPTEDWTPAAELDPARIEAFLAVRAAIAAPCAALARIDEETRRMEALGADGREPSVPEALGQAFRLTTAIVGGVDEIGHLLAARNRALLDVGMTLAEYEHIWLLAYAERVLPAEEDDFIGGSPVDHRVRANARRRLERLHARGVGPDLGGPLAAEIAALTADPSRVPWRDGPPEPWAHGLALHRARLDELWCTGGSAVELSVARREEVRGIPVGWHVE